MPPHSFGDKLNETLSTYIWTYSGFVMLESRIGMASILLSLDFDQWPSLNIRTFRQFLEEFSRCKAHWHDFIHTNRKCFIVWLWFPCQKFPDTEVIDNMFSENRNCWSGRGWGIQDVWIWNAKNQWKLEFQAIFAKNLKATSSLIDDLWCPREKYAKKGEVRDFLYS